IALFGQLAQVRDGMSRLQSGDDSFGAAQQAHPIEGLSVADRLVAGAPRVGIIRMLGTNTGIIEPGRHRVSRCNLAIVSLQNIAHRAMEHADGAQTNTGAVSRRVQSMASSLNANKARFGVAKEGGKQADAV